MLLSLSPAAALSGYVTGYWFVQDLAGDHRDKAIVTIPQAGGVLTINLGRPNRVLDGGLTPTLSLLGVRTRARNWQSDANTCFVMIMLTCSGMARLIGLAPIKWRVFLR